MQGSNLKGSGLLDQKAPSMPMLHHCVLLPFFAFVELEGTCSVLSF